MDKSRILEIWDWSEIIQKCEEFGLILLRLHMQSMKLK